MKGALAVCLALTGLVGTALVWHSWPSTFHETAPPVPHQSPWNPMVSAPRDGTIIELCCTYGVQPWYGLFRWTSTIEVLTMQGEDVTISLGEPGWFGVDGRRRGQGVMEEAPRQWRPYEGDPNTYVDPTHGAQETHAYWLTGTRRTCATNNTPR